MLKEFIRDSVIRNINVSKNIFSIYDQLVDYNRLFEKMCSEFQEIDSILDFCTFQKKVAEYKNNGKISTTKNVHLENWRVYGLLSGIFPEYKGDEIYELPSIEHGLILHDQIFGDLMYTSRPIALTFSEFRANIIKQCSDNILPIAIGPYIQYIDSYYSEAKIKEIKKKLGKTMLFFPTHTTDTATIKCDVKKICDAIEREASGFDTVLVSAYWWNIDDPLIHVLIEAGYKVVSAGYRYDVSFSKRLKTIIQLSDFAVGDGIGTHIGYCIEENVPFKYLELGSEIKTNNVKEQQDWKIKMDRMKEIKSAFIDSTGITEYQMMICNKYWGNGIHLSREELNDIVHTNKNIIRQSNGNVNKYKCYFV